MMIGSGRVILYLINLNLKKIIITIKHIKNKIVPLILSTIHLDFCIT
jgi:hypothetical protein